MSIRPPIRSHRAPRGHGVRRSAAGRATFATVALTCVAALVAGCGGGSSSPGVAHLAGGNGASNAADPSSGSSSSGSDAERQQKLVAFAQCMRSHGVAEFPEPAEGHILFHPGGAGGLHPDSPQFKAAAKTCRKLLPNGGEPTPQQRAELQERALKFSDCMRSHGLPNFPTPTFEGNGVHLGLKADSGLDPRSPQFQAAAKACRSYFGPPGGKGGPGGPPSGIGG